MRRSLVLVSLVSVGSVLVGCSIETEPPVDPPKTPVACAVKTVTPTFGASGVGTRPAITITYNQDVDAAAIESHVSLSRLGEEAVPFTVEATAPDTIVIHPVSELRYWEEYAATVSGDLATADGSGTCPAVDLAFATLAPAEEPQPLRATQVSSSVLLDATHLVSASPSARSLQLYSVADPAHPALVSEIRMQESPAGLAIDPDAVAFPNRLYVAAGGSGVPIFDTTDPSAPKRIGTAGTPGEVRRAIPFEADGRAFLLVADAAGGMRLIDVTTPDGSKDVWVQNLVEGAVSVAKSGKLVAVVDLKGSVSLFDLTNPLSPVRLSTTAPVPSDDTFGNAIAFNDVAFVGNELVLSQTYAGFESFDITDPTAPVFQQHLLGPQGKCAANCADVLGDLHVAGGSVYAASLLTGAVRLTVDDAGVLAIPSTFNATGRANSVTWVPGAGAGTLLVGGDAGLFSFDAGGGATVAPTFSEANGWGIDWGIAVSGDNLYVSSSSRGLETFDLANPLAPASHALATSPGAERDVGLIDVTVAGNVVLVGDGRAGVSVFDASQPNAPAFAASAASDDSAGVVIPSADPHYFYACLDNRGVGVVDVTNPSEPAVVDELPELNADVGGCKDIQLVGTRLYYSGGTGLAIIDVTNPAALVFKSSLKLPAEDLIGSLAHSASIPDRLFTTTFVFDWEGEHFRSQRLLSFDISDPDQPKIAWRSEDLGGVRTLELHDTKAWLSGGGEGLAIFDLADPDAPFLEGKIETRGAAQRIAFGDHDTVYIAELAGGVGAVRIQPAPAAP